MNVCDLVTTWVTREILRPARVVCWLGADGIRDSSISEIIEIVVITNAINLTGSLAIALPTAFQHSLVQWNAYQHGATNGNLPAQPRDHLLVNTLQYREQCSKRTAYMEQR